MGQLVIREALLTFEDRKRLIANICTTLFDLATPSPCGQFLEATEEVKPELHRRVGWIPHRQIGIWASLDWFGQQGFYAELRLEPHRRDGWHLKIYCYDVWSQFEQERGSYERIQGPTNAKAHP